MKLNPLPSTLRERHRYLVFEILSQKDFDLSVVVNAVWNAVLQLIGELGTSRSSLWIANNLYDKKKRRGVIRCNHTSVEEVRAAISSIRQIQNEPVIIRILGVTGTIKSAKRKYLGMTDVSLVDFGRTSE